MFGSLYDGECSCAECERKQGKRTVEAWNKIEIPDYGVLLNVRFWLNPDKFMENSDAVKGENAKSK